MDFPDYYTDIEFTDVKVVVSKDPHWTKALEIKGWKNWD